MGNKLKVREQTLRYAKTKKQKMLREEEELEKKINILQRQTDYIEGQFSTSQRRGIIKLIPKKGAEPYFVKNWRPITLLNSDYKIAAKAIANRLQNVLPKLIDSDQTGFFKGRFIGKKDKINRWLNKPHWCSQHSWSVNVSRFRKSV